MRAIAVPIVLALLAGPAHAQTEGEAASEPAAQPQVQQPRRSRVPYPPISVAPPVIDVPRSVSAPPAPALPPAPPRATAITTCDAGGCWDSDGRRLNIVGPLLVGPGGTCTAQSGVVHCP